MRQDELLLQIDDGQPLQPMAPRERLLGVVIHAPHKKRAHRDLGQSGRIHCHLRATSRMRQCHTTDYFIQSMSDGGFVQPPQEAIQSCVVGNRTQPKSTAQFRVLGSRTSASRKVQSS